MANASTTTPTTQRFTPAKSLLTQNLRATQKSTSIHTTKGLRITHRLTSAHVTAAKSPAVPRTSPRFRTTSTPKGRGSAPSGQLTQFRFPHMAFMCHGRNFKFIRVKKLSSLWFIVGRVSS